MDFIVRKIFENSCDIHMIAEIIAKNEKLNNRIFFFMLLDIIGLMIINGKHEKEIKMLQAQIEEIKSKGV